MRVTTSSIVRNYQHNLGLVQSGQNTAYQKVLTHRNYSKASQAPGLANQAARLHRQYLKNQDYIDTIKDTQDRLDMASSVGNSMEELANEILNDKGLASINGTLGHEQRVTYSKILEEMQSNMLQFANTTYNDKYLFSGQHTSEPPFTIEGGTVKYLGLDVSNPDNLGKLNELANESVYIDVGMDISSGTINSANAFDASIPAIKLLGYGTDSGVSKNLLSLTGEMAELLKSSDADWEAGNAGRFNDLMGQFKKTHNNFIDEKASVGINQNYLSTALDNHEDLDIAFQEQINDVEYVDDATAISDFYYAQYAYNAALNVGNSMLSASLLDFLN